MSRGATQLKPSIHDSERISQVLSQAFETDPPLNWLIRQDHRKYVALQELFSVAFRKMTHPFGCVEASDDFTGVALWTPPQRWKLSLDVEITLLPTFIRVLGFRGFGRKMQAIHQLQRHHPKKPHYYLFAMGVLPHLQGKGIGTALIRSRLLKCDREQVPVYLEASTEMSRKLYERMGFKTLETIQIAAGAPPIWGMWRTPKPTL